jgi:hypothetical protein
LCLIETLSTFVTFVQLKTSRSPNPKLLVARGTLEVMPPKVIPGYLTQLSRFKVRWDRPGGEAAFRHLHDNDLIKQDRRKNADRKK